MNVFVLNNFCTSLFGGKARPNVLKRYQKSFVLANSTFPRESHPGEIWSALNLFRAWTLRAQPSRCFPSPLFPPHTNEPVGFVGTMGQGAPSCCGCWEGAGDEMNKGKVCCTKTP